MDTGEQESESVRLRAEGNQHFRSAAAGLGVNAAVRATRLEHAIAHYERAHAAATCGEEQCSALKNQAVAARHLIQLLSPRLDLERIGFYCVKAAVAVAGALESGGPCKKQSWLSYVQQELVTLLQVITRLEAKHALRLRYLWKIVNECADPFVQANTYWTLSVIGFNHSVVLLEERKVKESWSELRDVQMPLDRALACARRAGGLSLLWTDALGMTVGELETSLQHHLVMCEARMQLNIAAELFGSSMFEEEYNHDMMWEIADRYKHAIVCARERDLETEAESSARLGVLLHKCFKLPNAMDYLHRSIAMVHAMMPCKHVTQEWYKNANKLLKELQEKVTRHHDEKEAEKRKPYVEKLSAEIAALRVAADEGSVTLLKHCYAKHAPRGYTEEFSVPTNANLKSLLQKAIIHYHPDKVHVGSFDTEDEGLTCKVLYEEIVKVLTNKYQSYK
eukprot:TRINITY_DN1368_c2_g1_i1.p1 TRINITY_DN1368_c2_g1~~TRINITY_DN1368_c2_g1_i1.p1  ORF type:complete len:465 (+),score=199.28 TRINITY_DN1368_c2_g1_i1:45-1397(+)